MSVISELYYKVKDYCTPSTYFLSLTCLGQVPSYTNAQNITLIYVQIFFTFIASFTLPATFMSVIEWPAKLQQQIPISVCSFYIKIHEPLEAI